MSKRPGPFIKSHGLKAESKNENSMLQSPGRLAMQAQEFFDQGKYNKASEVICEAIKLDPKAEYRLFYGQCFFLRQEYDEAERIFNDIGKEGKDYSAGVMLFASLCANSKYKEAKGFYANHIATEFQEEGKEDGESAYGDIGKVLHEILATLPDAIMLEGGAAQICGDNSAEGGAGEH